MTETAIGMTSLKDIAAEVVAHHDLLEGSNKENLPSLSSSSDHPAAIMRRMLHTTLRLLLFAGTNFSEFSE